MNGTFRTLTDVLVSCCLGTHHNNYPSISIAGITIALMVRPPLSKQDRERGVRLGEILRAARGDRTSVEIAAQAGISVETLRKIEHGRVPTPAFFTVVAIARAVDVPLDSLCLDLVQPDTLAS